MLTHLNTKHRKLTKEYEFVKKQYDSVYVKKFDKECQRTIHYDCTDPAASKTQETSQLNEESAYLTGVGNSGIGTKEMVSRPETVNAKTEGKQPDSQQRISEGPAPTKKKYGAGARKSSMGMGGKSKKELEPITVVKVQFSYWDKYVEVGTQCNFENESDQMTQRLIQES